jgi:hypothetical protein
MTDTQTTMGFDIIRQYRERVPGDSSALHRVAIAMLELPMIQWQEVTDMLSEQDKILIEGEMDALIQKAARLVGYLEARGTMTGSDSGHKAGVKQSNMRVKGVRKALGYSIAKSDVSF